MIKTILILTFISIPFYSCIDEPEIEPVGVPFSTTRVGNFTTEEFTLTVEGENKGTIAVNEVIDYFDLVSGQRSYTVTKPDGQVIFDNAITAISYEESSLFFGGHYETEDIQTFSFRSFIDGKTYLRDGIRGADTAVINFVNVVNLMPDDTSSASVEVEITNLDTSFTIGTSLTKQTVIREAGDYNVSFALTDIDTVTTTLDYTFNSDIRYYVYVVGNLEEIQVLVDEIDPLPARSK